MSQRIPKPITLHLTVPQAKWLLLVLCMFRKVAAGNERQMAQRISLSLRNEVTRETGEQIDLDTYLTDHVHKKASMI